MKISFWHSVTICCLYAGYLFVPVCEAEDRGVWVQPRSCSLAIGRGWAVVHEQYQVSLLHGKQKIVLDRIPPQADLSSLIIRNKRVNLNVSRWERVPIKQTKMFRLEKNKADWTRDTIPFPRPIYSPKVNCWIEAPVAGRRLIDVIYCVTGITWTANYQLITRGDMKQAQEASFAVDLNGRVVVENRTSRRYDEASIYLVGNRASATAKKEHGFLALSESPLADLWYRPKIEELPENVYAIQGRYDLPEKGDITLMIIEALRIPAERNFVMDSEKVPLSAGGSGIPLDEIISIMNTKKIGLGTSLPPGRVLIYRAGALRYQMATAQMQHAHRNREIKINLGTDPDVVAYRSKQWRTDEGEGLFREGYEILIANHHTYPIHAVLNEVPDNLLKWQLISATEDWIREAGQVQFDLNLARETERIVEYTIQTQHPVGIY